MEYVTRKVPIKIGPTPVPAFVADAANMLDEFAERDNLVDAPVVAGQLRALLIFLQDGKPWEAEDEVTVVDRLNQHFIEGADGQAAAHQLARACIINPDKSITIAPEHTQLLVRMCTALGTAGPFLVEMLRRGRALVKTVEKEGGFDPA